MRLVVDLETGFRGFVLTKQVGYLNPYRVAHDHILTVGDSLKDMVQGRSPQQEYVQEVQGLIRRLMSEKDGLIQAIRDGHSVDALHYLEQGRGRALMLLIREKMDQFDRLELSALNDALEKIARDRSLMIMHIMGGIVFALALMVFALHLISRSITGPLVTLAKSVRSSTGLVPPDVPVLARRDEIGELTRVMSAMSAQLRTHLTQMEQSEAELRTLNQHLAASESKYRSIVDHAPLGIFTTKGMAMTFINRHNRVLAGLDPDQEVDPEVIRQLMHPEDRDRVLTEFAKAVEENRPYETIFRFLHRDGTVRKVLSRRIPIRDEEGRMVMYQGFNIDITALHQMQARLSRVERLATLGQVAAGIAHEIRNPLVGIGSTASLLLDDAEPCGPSARGPRGHSERDTEAGPHRQSDHRLCASPGPGAGPLRVERRHPGGAEVAGRRDRGQEDSCDLRPPSDALAAPGRPRSNQTGPVERLSECRRGHGRGGRADHYRV